MKTKTILTLLLVALTISIFAQNKTSKDNTIAATLENLTKCPVIAFHTDELTIQGMTEADTMFIKNAHNFVFKKDDAENLLNGYQFFAESSFFHPHFNVDIVLQYYYDKDSLTTDVYSTIEVSRKTKRKGDLKAADFNFTAGWLPTSVLGILQSKGFRTIHQKDTLLNGKPYLYIDALSVADTLQHELLIDKQRNLPYFLRKTTNTFQPFIEEFTYSSFGYPDSFEKPQSMLQPIKGEVQKAKPLVVGDAVPDWKLNLLTGEPFLFEKLKGKKTILYVSMINCGPCQAAVPFLQELTEKYATNSNVNVVVFYPYDSKVNLNKYIKTKGIKYPVVYNSSIDENERVAIMNNMQLPMPTFLILDKNNKIVDRVVGFEIDKKDRIKELIDEKLNAI